MKTEQDIFLEHIQSLPEDTFTKKVLMPLFKEMGYFDVHFHGGPKESGKDLIAVKDGEFGDYSFTVIQSKKISKKGRISEKLAREYIAQLNQCLRKKIGYTDGREYLPSCIYFATPYAISTRTLEEQFESLQNFDGKMRVIDGPIIYKAIKKSSPHLISALLPTGSEAVETPISDLQNLELLKALRSETDAIEEDWYSDLDFFVGKAELNEMLRCSICSTDTNLRIPKESWEKSKKHFITLFERDLPEGKIEIVEKEYNAMRHEYFSKENQKNIVYMKNLEAPIEDNRITILERAKEEKSDNDIRMEIGSLSSEEKDILCEFGYAIQDVIKACSNRRDFLDAAEKKYPIFDKVIGHEAKVSKNKIIEAKKIYALTTKMAIEKRGLSSMIKPAPLYNVSIKGEKLEEWWRSVVSWYEKTSEEIEAHKISSAHMKDFFSNIHKELSAANAILHINDELCEIARFERSRHHSKRLSISINKIFNAGINSAIYGEAGAGKTTTLQIYAKQEIEKNEKSVFYFPLNRIVSSSRRIDIKIYEHLDQVELFFVFLLTYKNIDNPANAVGAVINSLNDKRQPVFIFDAIDEAVRDAPWIIRAINDFPEKISGCQVIVSSRDCVNYIEDIDFVGLTLLPFNEEQLSKFIHGRLGSHENAKGLISKLSEFNLTPVIKNPLLATIICSFAKKGLDIPNNEFDVYRKRIRLLCGMYDTFKDVTRTENAQDALEDAARRIAFSLHSRNRRQASKKELITYLLERSSNKIGKEEAENLVNELIDPCNVLRKIPFEDAYTFGHLRFQEHLTTEEIMRDRNFDIVAATRSEWWSGVLYLYSLENRIDDLIEMIYHQYGTVKPSEITLRKMYSAKPKNEQQGLVGLLNGFLQQDALFEPDPLYNDYEHYRYELDGYMGDDLLNFTPE